MKLFPIVPLYSNIKIIAHRCLDEYKMSYMHSSSSYLTSMSLDERHYKWYDEEKCFAAIRDKNKHLVPHHTYLHNQRYPLPP